MGSSYINTDNINDLSTAIIAFKRYRWLALEEFDRGNRDAAIDRLAVAAGLRVRILQLGGSVPF